MELSDTPRILIVLLGALGDVVRGLGVVRAIKAARPQAHITWLVESASSELVRLNPDIDEVVVFRRAAGWRGALEVLGNLRQREFDVTLDMQRHLKSGLLSWFSGASRRIGFNPDDAKEFNWLLNNEYIEARGDELPKIEHYQLFVHTLGLPVPAVIDAGLSHVTLATVREDLRPQLSSPYVGIVLGSSRYSKDWPEEGYRELLERWNVSGINTVVLLGDRSKSRLSQELRQIDSQARIIDLVGVTTLRELVGVIGAARACVGPDSGPAHIAAALGVPHVTLFGPTPSVRNAPRGSESLSIVSGIACSPCRRRVCPGLDKLCMRLISADVVIQRLNRLTAGGVESAPLV